MKNMFDLSFLFYVSCFRCLEGVLNLHKEIKEDEYLVPYAIVEIALLYIDSGRIDNAIAALEDAKYVKIIHILCLLFFFAVVVVACLIFSMPFFISFIGKTILDIHWNHVCTSAYTMP